MRCVSCGKWNHCPDCNEWICENCGGELDAACIEESVMFVFEERLEQ
jgi:hypothetical protein